MSGNIASRPRRGPTVHDVARHAGVSSMTVSRVLSGNTKVRDEMRMRVETSVKALGYRRNENARSLRPGQRTGLIGVTITNIANPNFAEMLLGIEEVASRYRRRILVGNTNDDVRQEIQLISDFTSRQVEGLIIVPSSGESGHLAPNSLGSIPVTLASRPLPDLDVDTVLIDDVSGAYAGTMRLLDAGHRRIAFLGNGAAIALRRYEGFRAAHHRYDIEPAPELVRQEQRDTRSAQQATQALLQLPDPPTAVFSSNNRNAIGALRALHLDTSPHTSAGTKIPLICFDNFETADLIPYPLTIINHDPREMGRKAADLLVGRLEGTRSDAPPQTIMLGATTLD